jgi:hypothetical protein
MALMRYEAGCVMLLEIIILAEMSV